MITRQDIKTENRLRKHLEGRVVRYSNGDRAGLLRGDAGQPECIRGERRPRAGVHQHVRTNAGRITQLKEGRRHIMRKPITIHDELNTNRMLIVVVNRLDIIADILESIEKRLKPSVEERRYCVGLKCQHCDGTGFTQVGLRSVCPHCKGKGVQP